MKIATLDVITPFDDTVGYSWDWRHLAALAAATPRDLPVGIRKDRSLKAYIQSRQSGAKVSDATKAFLYMPRWHAGEIGAILRAALLTSASCSEIGKALGIEPSDVALYRDLCCDVRDVNDKVLPIAIARAQLQQTDGEPECHTMLRRAALKGDFGLLKRMLGLEDRSGVNDESDHDEVARLAADELLRRLLGGALSTGDLSKVISNALTRQRNLIDAGESETSVKLRRCYGALVGVLKLMAPELVPQETTAEEKVAQDERLRAHLANQSQIAGGGLSPAGSLTEEKGKAMIDRVFGQFAGPAVKDAPASVGGTPM